ncbi:unnamed protein product [Urochloa decumbens]|uniref:F-box domain-containing protein n=1 Tax=Urochloa decumbens TaxID=240449 RepID=A0ABC9GBA1_9POAL
MGSPWDQEDLLSKLSSDVLVSILEKLHLGEAMRAGVLSRRWRSLPHQLPRLALGVNDFVKPGEEYNYYEDEGCDMLPDFTFDTLARASEAMFDAIWALLRSRADETPVCTLAVSFLLRGNYMSIGHLLDDAMASGEARAIEMTISTNYTRADINDMKHIINVKLAYGRRFRMLFDAYPAAFGGLTRLTMKNMRLLRHDIHDILATCTRIEMLSLEKCDAGPRSQVPWRVRHARLAELSITYCIFTSIDLDWLPSLKRFTYRSWICTAHPILMMMSFGHVPQLNTVTLSNDQMIGQPILKFSQALANTAVADLRLNFRGQDVWVEPEGPKRFIDIFCNLKHIKIRNLHQECGLSWITFLLQASPFLKELHIKLWDHKCGMVHKKNAVYFATKKTNVPWEAAVNFKHYGLTRVTILGLYNTGEEVIAYIRCLAEAAINLEEIRMRKNTPCKECGIAGTGFPRTVQERESLRHKISGGEPVSFKLCIQS